MSRYGVPFTKGPEIRLEPHPQSCELDQVKDAASKLPGPLAIDLFSGAGGLSFGLHLAGFNVLLAVDIEKEAIATHRAHFPGVSLHADLSDPEVVHSICSSLDGIELDLVAGGPPCQPYSQAAFSKVRHLQQFHGKGADVRRTLWTSFIEVVQRTRPAAVLVENVPDMAFGRDGIVLRKLVSDLEALGYGVHTRILSSESYGVPQHRQRLFTVAFREPRNFVWPQGEPQNYRVLADAIGDLPEVQGGEKVEVRPYESKPTPKQEYFRATVSPTDANLIFDHNARAVRPDDLEAFKLMSPTTKYSDLPEHLKRYRDDIFEDKYKRLDLKSLSRTITAHISQDGYWYIHPVQNRTLSIREAARIQTFPDSFRFCGYPRHALKQIGEAVPPLLARAVGTAIHSAIQGERLSELSNAPETAAVSEKAKRWFSDLGACQSTQPWLYSDNAWIKILGAVLFERASPSKVVSQYAETVSRWPSAGSLARDKRAASFAECKFRADPFFALVEVAKRLAKGEVPSHELLGESGLTEALSHRIMAICGLATRRPVTASLERLTRRILNFEPTNVDGRGTVEMLLGRLTGQDEDGLVYCALLEIGNRFCTSANPGCGDCPLSNHCQFQVQQEVVPQVSHGVVSVSAPNEVEVGVTVS